MYHACVCVCAYLRYTMRRLGITVYREYGVVYYSHSSMYFISYCAGKVCVYPPSCVKQSVGGRGGRLEWTVSFREHRSSVTAAMTVFRFPSFDVRFPN